MEKGNKRKIFRLVLPIIVGIILLIGVSYAWFVITINGTKNQVIKSGKLLLTLDESISNGILLEDAIPVTDMEGLRTPSYKFTIKNTGKVMTRYTVRLTDQAVTGKRIPDTNIKFWIKGNSEVGPKLLSSTDNRGLDTGVLDAGQSVSYELKIWIDYDADQEAQNAEFNVKLAIDGIQVPATDESCFTFDSATGTITEYKCYAGNTEGKPTVTDLVIPSQIGGVAVTTIGTNAFNGKQLTNVIIPYGITYIRGGAFYSNKIVNVTIPNSVTFIETYAFFDNQLTSIVIPSSVMRIESNVFVNNKLTSVIIKGKSTSDDFTSYPQILFGWADGYSDANIEWEYTPTQESCFTFDSSTGSLGSYKCYAGNTEGMPTITDVVIPSKIGGVSVKAIGWNIWNLGGRGITSVIIPRGVTTIRSGAFAGNLLTSVTIPDTVTYIDTGAFSDNQLTSVTLSPGLETIANVAFANNKLTTITIPDSVTSIEREAFAHNELTRVHLPSNINEIAYGVFSNNKLTTITIPDSVTTIDSWAFAYNQLTSIIIPSNVTSILGPAPAFYENKLTSVIIKGKSSSADFSTYGDGVNSPFQGAWAPGYSDATITWQP